MPPLLNDTSSLSLYNQLDPAHGSVRLRSAFVIPQTVFHKKLNLLLLSLSSTILVFITLLILPHSDWIFTTLLSMAAVFCGMQYLLSVFVTTAVETIKLSPEYTTMISVRSQQKALEDAEREKLKRNIQPVSSFDQTNLNSVQGQNSPSLHPLGSPIARDLSSPQTIHSQHHSTTNYFSPPSSFEIPPRPPISSMSFQSTSPTSSFTTTEKSIALSTSSKPTQPSHQNHSENPQSFVNSLNPHYNPFPDPSSTPSSSLLSLPSVHVENSQLPGLLITPISSILSDSSLHLNSQHYLPSSSRPSQPFVTSSTHSGPFCPIREEPSNDIDPPCLDPPPVLFSQTPVLSRSANPQPSLHNLQGDVNTQGDDVLSSPYFPLLNEDGQEISDIKPLIPSHTNSFAD